ncbi:MAG: class I SAM-dependent methyltransferase [Candidatus Zambryskibacteria bacterium]|nr:class I SAM-dependent methyltransferase [Candidatus Zambryskibacteria bacterium]
MKKENSINNKWWEERATIHEKSEYYNIAGLINGDIRLRNFEIEEMGDVKNKKLLHLQCHMGTETLSWARLGAKVTGIDFSLNAIKVAKRISKQAGVDVNYIHSNVYDSLKHFKKDSFDIVYVSVGSLHWLNDINKWANVVYNLLKPGGILYIYEFHPVSSVLSKTEPLFERNYFSTNNVLWDEEGSYTDSKVKTKNNKHIIWDRPLCEIINAILNVGLNLEIFKERHGQEGKQFSYLVKNKSGLWVVPKGVGTFPSTFTLRAKKNIHEKN